MHFSRSHRYRWLWFLVITAVNLFIYLPSFKHVARSDQLIYLANTQGIEGWFSLAVKTYSYDRVPHIFEGLDSVLFRPFFFFFLGTEKFLFGYDFMAWQITGLILHLFVMWNMLRLLWRIRPDMFAGLTTLYFSVLLIGSEMVVWHHVNGYLIFLSCILRVLYHLYDITIERQVRWRQLAGIFLCLMIAVLTYELGLVYSLLFFIYIWLSTTKSKSKISKFWYILVLLPGVLYVIINLVDLHARHINYSQGQTVLTAFHIGPTLKRAALSMYWCLYAGLFPGHVETRLLQRTVFNINNFPDWKETFNVMGLWKFQVAGVLGMVGGYVIQTSRRWSEKVFKDRGKFVALVGLMLLAQMILIVMARINFKELVDVLRHNGYYGYYFWMYLVIILYSFYGMKEVESKNSPFLKWGTAFLLIVVISVNGFLVRKLNKKRAKADTVRHFLVKSIEGHIKESQSTGEAFSFLVDPKIALELPWVRKDRDKSGKIYTFLELLYPDYFDKKNPRYIYKLGKDGIKIGRRY